jgi:citrate synthase
MIQDLAANSPYEEIVYLLLYGELPTRAQLDELSRTMRSRRDLPNEAMGVLRALPKTGEPIDVLRTVVSSLALLDPDVNNTARDVVIDKAITLAAQMPTIVAAYDRIRDGKQPVGPNRDLGHTANLLYMLRHEVPSNEDAAALNTYFVLAAEHSLNASTFTSLVTTSTLSDYYSAIVAAISALRGTAHGGANQKAMEMMMEIGDVDKIDEFIDNALATKRRLMGMGHRIYKTRDPRARHLARHAEALAKMVNDPRWFDIADRLDKMSGTHPYFSERKIYPNVEFYSAPVLYGLGLQPDLMPAAFAVSRIAGWTGHLLEQIADNRIFRPSAAYDGPAPRAYPAVEARG